jgi:serine/threonine protein kinase
MAARLTYPELEPYLLKGVRKTDDPIDECKRLGNGSLNFGVVDELYVQGILCAAKQLHSSLLDPRTQGVDRVISREFQIMTSVRHPNIVQFLGLHIFANATHPTLVMEKLAMSLEDLLDETNKKKEDIPLSLKVSILSDTAKGLVYLHNHKPQIIHRDLTTRNILLTLAMQAKITDLGNALIIDSDTVAMTMTQTPGTAVYMPPEAIHAQARYDSTIDMFSYGHLALYTIIQEFPRDLLPATYMEESKRQLCARSEIERRKKYINVLHQKMGKHHPLTHIIERCLDNMSDERPSALQVLENLEEMSKTVKSSRDDFYHDYQHTSKLDLIKMLDGTHKSRTESVASPSPYVSIGPEGKTAHEYLQLVGEDPSSNTATNFMLDQSEKIKVMSNFLTH